VGASSVPLCLVGRWMCEHRAEQELAANGIP